MAGSGFLCTGIEISVPVFFGVPKKIYRYFKIKIFVVRCFLVSLQPMSVLVRSVGIDNTFVFITLRFIIGRVFEFYFLENFNIFLNLDICR